MKTGFIFIILNFFLFTLNAQRKYPYPLTVEFYEAYMDIEVVQLALSSNGFLNDELMSYLSDSTNPLDVKIAIINALKYGQADFSKSNAKQFYAYLKEKHTINDINEADADILICYAYLRAMDNISKPQNGLEYAKKAKSKNNKSFVINIIYSLIYAAEIYYDSATVCPSYKVVNNVRENESNLILDMRKEAIDKIFSHFDNYKSLCK